MARTARTHSDSGVYHVILRGVNKQQIFECTEDYQRFLNILRTLTVLEQDESGHRSKYVRIGHLFQERFKSQPVGDWDYFLTLLRYIHQNPLKPHLVTSLREYKSVWRYHRC